MATEKLVHSIKGRNAVFTFLKFEVRIHSIAKYKQLKLEYFKNVVKILANKTGICF